MALATPQVINDLNAANARLINFLERNDAATTPADRTAILAVITTNTTLLSTLLTQQGMFPPYVSLSFPVPPLALASKGIPKLVIIFPSRRSCCPTYRYGGCADNIMSCNHFVYSLLISCREFILMIPVFLLGVDFYVVFYVAEFHLCIDAKKTKQQLQGRQQEGGATSLPDRSVFLILNDLVTWLGDLIFCATNYF